MKKSVSGKYCSENAKSKAYKTGKASMHQYSKDGGKCKPGYRQAAKKGPGKNLCNKKA